MSPVGVLVGPPGAGKTTVAHALADRLGVAFRDTDEDIEHLGEKLTLPPRFEPMRERIEQILTPLPNPRATEVSS